MNARILRPLTALAILAAGASHAATIVVDTANDEFGDNMTRCALREAVQAANTNAAFGGCTAGAASGLDVINLGARRHVLDLGTVDENSNAEGDLDITSEIIVNGPEGAARTFIVANDAGGNRDRLFDVRTSSASLFVLGVSLRGGDIVGADAPDGGVIRRTAGDVSLVRCVVTAGAARHGGGIYSSGNGALALSGTTVHGNSATGSGGGIYSASGALSTIENSTISSNYAASGPSGVTVTGNLRIDNSTIAFNRSSAGSSGGGLGYTGTAANGDTVSFHNSIFADNSDANGGTSSDISCFNATLHGGGYNLWRRTSCTFAQPNNSFVGDAKLSPLFDFGRGVPTHAPLAGSDAIDNGAPASSGVACPPTDQRGVSRPTNQCDVGAYEQTYDFMVNTTSDAVDVNIGDGLCRTSANQCSLRAAIQEATQSGDRHMIRLPAGTYAISLGASGSGGGDLDIRPPAADTERQIAIFGAGAATTHIVGTGLDRLFDIHGEFGAIDEYPTAVALVGISISGGEVGPNTSEPYGGGIHVSNADVLLVDAVVADNLIEDGYGGGIAIDDANANGDLRGRATLERVAVIDNVSFDTPEATFAHTGGGVYAGAGSVRANNSTFSHNLATYGGGISVAGNYGIARLTNVTIAANRVRSDGGGIYSQSEEVTIKSSIVADNVVVGGFGTRPDCQTSTGDPLISLGYNVIGDADGCTLSGDVATNLLDVDAQLSVLDRHLVLPAHYAQPGSSVLNVIPSSQCADAALLRAWRDQNGGARPAPGSTACDAGASEGVGDIIFADGVDDP